MAEMKWWMSQINWDNFINDCASVGTGNPLSDDYDMYGSLYIGGVDFEILMQDDAKSPAYVNVYVVREGATYSVLKNGMSYDLLDVGPAVPLVCSSFEEFKHTFEQNAKDFIVEHNLAAAAAQPISVWGDSDALNESEGKNDC